MPELHQGRDLSGPNYTKYTVQGTNKCHENSKTPILRHG